MPVLVFLHWIELFRAQKNGIYVEISRLQVNTGLIKPAVKGKQTGLPPEYSPTDLIDLSKVHRDSATAHDLTVNSLPTFVEAFGECLTTSFVVFNLHMKAHPNPGAQKVHVALSSFTQDLVQAAKVEIESRKVFAARIELQLNIVSNLSSQTSEGPAKLSPRFTSYILKCSKSRTIQPTASRSRVNVTAPQ